MHGLILAGGEGTRLAADGIEAPKPLAEVAGEAQVTRLTRTLHRLGAESLTVMVREPFVPEVRSALRDVAATGVRVVPCATPSSLHTLVAGLDQIAPGAVFCTMVDTVMPDPDWGRLWRSTAQALEDGASLVLAVTAYVDDESPLWVRRDAAGRALAVGREPVDPPCVSGGVYGLSAVARQWAAETLASGAERMRAFLASAVERSPRVATVDVARIIDLDRGRDLEQARDWFNTLSH